MVTYFFFSFEMRKMFFPSTINLAQFSGQNKKQTSETSIKQAIVNIIMVLLQDLWGINKVLLLLNEHGNLSFLFQNLSSYNINNQKAKFDKNLSASSILVE